MLDKDDQKSGGKPTGNNTGGNAGNNSSSGPKSGGGKMGAGSSQSGGTKSSGGKMGSGSSQTGAKGSSTSGMGSKSANAATGPKGYGGDSSGTGLGGKMGAKSSQTGGVKSTGGGLLGSGGHTMGGGLLSNPSVSSRVGGMVPTPRDHPFRDPSRFSYDPAGSVRSPDALANALPLSGLSQLANLQSAYGKPMAITSGYRSPAYNAKVGGALKSQHMAHKAVDLGIPTADRAKVAQLAKDMGFTGIGTYASKPNMVHVDLGPERSWGGVAKSALGGYQPGTPDMGAVAARVAAGSPTYGSIAPSLAAAVAAPSKFQDRVAPERFTGALPQPKPADLASAAASRNVLAGLGVNPGRAYPGAPTPGYQNPDRSFAGIPDNGLPGYSNPGRSFAGIPDSGFPSYSNPDRSFAGVSGQFPAVGAPEAVGQRQTANLDSLVAGRPDTPAPTGFPAAFASEFPGRPSPPQGFNSMIAGRPTPAPTFNSQMASRMSPPGAFPAAGTYENPAKSYAGIPPSGYPQQQVAQGIPNQVGREAYDPLGSISAPEVANIPDIQAPQQGWSFADLGEAVKSTVTTPVEKAKQLGRTFLDNLNHPGLGFIREPGPNNPHVAGGEGRPLRGGDGGQMWTGREPPQAVAVMQQHVEEILRQYLISQQAA